MTSATTDRRRGLTGDKGYKAPVTVATTANITLSGEQTIDGVAVLESNAAGFPDRVLVKNQTDTTQNGIYDVSTGTWTRSLDCNKVGDLVTGTQVLIARGTQAFQIWSVSTTTNPITPGTTALAFTQSLSAGFLATLAAAGGSALIGYALTATSAATRLVHDKLEEWVSITDFDGIVGDGLTDDTTAAAAALTNFGALFSGRKDLYVPQNITLLVSGLTLSTAGLRLFGPGTIKLKNASNKSVLTVSADGVSIEDILIDGNKANQTTVADVDASGVWVTNGVNRVKVRNTRIINCKRNGIAGYGNNERCEYTENTIENPAYIGIYPSSGSAYPFTRGVISDNTIYSPGQDGIGTTGMQSCTIKGNTVYSPTVAGISLEARSDNTTVTGNTVVGVGALDQSKGIQVNDCRGVTVTGNTCKSLGAGIVVAGGNTSDGVTVTGNTVDDCGYYFGYGIGVETSVASAYLACYWYGCTVETNTVLNSPYAGVYVNAVSGVNVNGNTIHNFNQQVNTTTKRYMGGIVLRGHAHDNTIADNQIYDSAGGNYRVGIYEVNDGSAPPYRNQIKGNKIAGLNQDVLISFNSTVQSSVERPGRGTAAPTANTWARGQIQFHNYPASGGSIGWVSSDQRGGSFGTLGAVTAIMSSGVSSATLSATAGLHDGMSVSIVGAVSGSVISSIDHGAKTIGLVDASTGAAAGAAVSLYNPTFKTWGVIS